MHTISHRGAEGAFARALLLGLSFFELVGALAVHGVLKVLVWQERARERNRLASLDDYMLRDLGLSRSDVARETTKPFWQA
jgi:uncharacterized protein YjiS (DUF1127 family)